MGYLNEFGLARYDGLIKNWVTLKSGTVDGIDPLLNWQKTDIASSVAFYPLPTAPLDPVVNFLFTETDPAEGEKSPTNPSVITGVSSITVTRCETAGVDETDYTVNLGSTFYGGSVDLSAGTMTVTWEAVKLTGNETWVLDSGSTEASSVFQSNLGLPNMTMSSTQNASTRCCSHFPYSGNSSVPYRFMTWGNTTRIYFAGPASIFPDTNSFKAFLVSEYTAGHPVILAYVKAIPQTVPLTSLQIYSLSQPNSYTPRINTVYSDQQSVQVGYPKSPLATSTELANAIISLGGNI